MMRQRLFSALLGGVCLLALIGPAQAQSQQGQGSSDNADIVLPPSSPDPQVTSPAGDAPRSGSDGTAARPVSGGAVDPTAYGAGLSVIGAPVGPLAQPTERDHSGVAPATGTTPTASPGTTASAPSSVTPPRPMPEPVSLMPLGPLNADLPQEPRMGASLPAPGVLRLTGETASVPMELLLPEGVAPPATLRLSLRSGINVLTDNAKLSVSVAGGPPVEVPLTNLGDFATVEVPVTGLVPGRNRIDISVVQPHRIFCGPDASFAVWTEIDLVESGIAIPSASIGADAAGFAAALGAQAMRGSRIVILADPAAAPQIPQKVAGLLADALGGTARISVRSFYGAPGNDLAMVAVIASDRPQVSFRRGASGAIILQVEYQGDTLPDLSSVLPKIDAGAAGQIPLLTTGREVSFSQLGQGDFTGNTHYFRKDVPFRLPDDWLLLANQKAEMTLHYGYGRGLAENSILLVKINDTTVRILPLDREGGKILEPLDIGFAANILHPGTNSASFEMMVPGNPADAVCEARRSDMLVVLGATTLDVPSSPKMRQPGVATALQQLGRDGVLIGEGSADAALAGEAAVALTGLVGPGQGGDSASQLTVVGLGNLGQVPLAMAGITAKQVTNTLFPPTEVSTAATPATTSAATPAATTAAPSASYSLTEEGDGAATAAPTEAAPSFMSRLWAGVERQFTLEGWVGQRLIALRDIASMSGGQSANAWLAERTGQALLVQPDSSEPGQLWLILQPEADVERVARAVVDLRAVGVAHGEIALLDKEGAWQIFDSRPVPELLEPLRPDNIRTVLGNYASTSPPAFTVALLAAALLSVIPAVFYLILTRRRLGGHR